MMLEELETAMNREQALKRNSYSSKKHVKTAGAKKAVWFGNYQKDRKVSRSLFTSKVFI